MSFLYIDEQKILHLWMKEVGQNGKLVVKVVSARNGINNGVRMHWASCVGMIVDMRLGGSGG